MPENSQSKFPTGECDDIHQSQVEGLIVDALPSREVGCFYEISSLRKENAFVSMAPSSSSKYLALLKKVDGDASLRQYLDKVSPKVQRGPKVTD